MYIEESQKSASEKQLAANQLEFLSILGAIKSFVTKTRRHKGLHKWAIIN